MEQRKVGRNNENMKERTSRQDRRGGREVSERKRRKWRRRGE